MWKCKHCKKEFDFKTTSEKGNHTKWCDENPNRNKTGKILSKLAYDKAIKLWEQENPICKICNEEIKFDRWRNISKDFCGKKKCRSEINRINSYKQDKTKISLQIRNSEKWIRGQRKNLLKRDNKLESSYNKAFVLLYDSVERNVPIKYKGRNKFIDFYINNDVYIEVDGFFHTKKNDSIVNDWIKDNNKKLIRVDIIKSYKYERESKFAEVLRSINKIKNGEIIKL